MSSRPRFAVRTAHGFAAHGRGTCASFTPEPTVTHYSRDLAYGAGVLAVGVGNFEVVEVGAR